MLIPVVADLCRPYPNPNPTPTPTPTLTLPLTRGRISPLTKQPVLVVAAGGIFDGRGLAMALSLGA